MVLPFAAGCRRVAWSSPGRERPGADSLPTWGPVRRHDRKPGRPWRRGHARYRCQTASGLLAKLGWTRGTRSGSAVLATAAAPTAPGTSSTHAELRALSARIFMRQSVYSFVVQWAQHTLVEFLRGAVMVVNAVGSSDAIAN
jgi:hypothetical protein